MKVSLRSKFLLYFIVGVGLTTPLGSYAQNWSLNEAKFRAVFIYNLMRFATLPEKGPEILVCVAGPSPFRGTLSQIENKPIGKRKLRTSETKFDKTCQVVFIANSYDPLEELIKECYERHILTISERPGFLASGGAVQMDIAKGRMVFDVNRTALDSSNVKLSSKVLRLARSVKRY